MKGNNNEKNLLFYNNINSTIPQNIINNFKDNTFFLIFVNPKSGSLEGNIILKYIKQYKELSIPDYNIIHFPIKKKNWFQNFLTNPNLEEKIIKGGIFPTNFDPLISFSVIIFNIIDTKEYYFGNMDSHHILFSRGWSQLKPFSADSKIVQQPRSFALQSIWEEANKDTAKYSSYWSVPVVKGVY